MPKIRSGGRASAARRSGTIAVLSVTLGVAILFASCRAAERTSSVILRVLMANDWVSTPPVVDAIRTFEKEHPNVTIEASGVLFEHMMDTVKGGINSGRPADVVQFHAFGAGAQGLAESLDDLWAASLVRDEFLPGAIEDVEWGGKLYGVPLDTNALLIIYNVEHFEEAGVEKPSETWTFSDFEEAARKLSATPDRKAIAIPTSTWHTYGWIRANGGEVVEVQADGSGSFKLADPRVVEAVDFLARLIQKGYAYPPIGAAGDRTDAFALLRSGAASMHASGSWDLAALEREGLGDKFEVAVMPRGTTGATQGSTMGGSSFFVPKGSKNKELAFEFMTHIISDHYAQRLAKEEGRLPVRLSVYEDSFFETPALQTFLIQLRSASPFKLESFPEAHDAFNDALDEVLQGRKDAQTAMAEAQQRSDAP